MRRIVLGLLLAVALLGVGYSYTRENAAHAYITAPIEKGTIENAELPHKMAEAQTAAAQARLDQAEKELQRKLQLVRSGTVTDRDLLQVQTQRDLPRASSTGAGRTWPSSRSLASTALGRRAATGRDCPRARQRSGLDPGGRADWGAR